MMWMAASSGPGDSRRSDDECVLHFCLLRPRPGCGQTNRSFVMHACNTYAFWSRAERDRSDHKQIEFLHTDVRFVFWIIKENVRFVFGS